MKILLTGSLAIDQIMTFNGLFEKLIQPDKLHILSVSFLVDKLRYTRGGIAGNIAYSLALLGECPILYASIGKKDKKYISDLSKMGVDISHVHYSKLPTACFNVLTDINDCQVGGFFPGAMSDSKKLKINRFKDDDVFVVVSAHDPQQMVKQIKECLDFKKRLFFDIGQQILVLSEEELLLGLKAAELLILNDYEMGVLCKKTNLSKEKLVRKVKVCVITLGGEGSVVYSKEKNWIPKKIKAIKVKKVIDPTGAGDCFRAGFLYGYVRGWKLRKSAKLGSTLASFTIEKHGTQKHKCGWKDIKKRYKENYKKDLKI